MEHPIDFTIKMLVVIVLFVFVMIGAIMGCNIGAHVANKYDKNSEWVFLCGMGGILLAIITFSTIMYLILN